MSRTALLTGGSGYIGGRLASRLARDGWSIHLVVRSERPPPGARSDFTFHHYDGEVVSLQRAIGAARPDVVFHLASLYLADHRPEQIDQLVQSNLALPIHLAEAMRGERPGKLVNFATASLHGGSDGYRPPSLYAATKQAALDLLRYYQIADGFSVVTLKLFDTYGPGDPRRKLVQLLVDAAITGEPIGLSPGEQTLDLTHVDDVVAATVSAADRIVNVDPGCFEEFFVSGERQTVRELASIVERALGRPVPARFGARPYREREIMMPVAAGAAQLPGWNRQRSLVEALPELASEHSQANA